jgi:hypothetical protein
MKNPCEVCLVKTMCSNICDKKLEYGEYWLKQLDGLQKHFYTQGGNRKNKKLIPKEIIKIKEKVIKRLDLNREQISKILLRPYGDFKL